MTRHQSFKRLVRTRMAKTGESYTAARATLLAAREPDAGPRPALATSDEMIRQRTGRGWEEWFDLLDEAGLAERPHPDIARWGAQLQGGVPLPWAAPAGTARPRAGPGGGGPPPPPPGGARPRPPNTGGYRRPSTPPAGVPGGGGGGARRGRP